jgi:hypothetical protein
MAAAAAKCAAAGTCGVEAEEAAEMAEDLEWAESVESVEKEECDLAIGPGRNCACGRVRKRASNRTHEPTDRRATAPLRPSLGPNAKEYGLAGIIFRVDQPALLPETALATRPTMFAAMAAWQPYDCTWKQPPKLW